MKTIDYWEQFLCTGKIDDYLAYCKEAQNEPEKSMGANPNAGTGQGYRDDIENRAHRRI